MGGRAQKPAAWRCAISAVFACRFGLPICRRSALSRNLGRRRAQAPDRILFLEKHGRAGAARRALFGIRARIARPRRAIRRQAAFERGSHPLVYWPGLVVFAGVTLGLLALIARRYRRRPWAVRPLSASSAYCFVAKAENFFRRNVPGVYRPDAFAVGVAAKA